MRYTESPCTGYRVKEVLIALVGGLFLSTVAIAKTPPRQQPNFVIVLADDLGITDISAYAERFIGRPRSDFTYQTPAIDALIADGLAFEQAYAAQLCSPTRAALLTGKLPATMGFTTATPAMRTYYSAGRQPPDGIHPLNTMKANTQGGGPNVRFLNGVTQTALPSGTEQDDGADEITIAEALTGYRSVFLGKWHLGGHGAIGYTPSDSGFETLAYLDSGGSPYRGWRSLWERTEKHFETMPQNELVLGDPGEEGPDTYLTDDLTRRAVRFITEEEHDKPFLLYLAHFAVHTPLQAPANTKPFDLTTDSYGQRNATYKAMIERLDASVAALRGALDDAGVSDNTYFVFMSDNGGVDWVLDEETPHVRPPINQPLNSEAPPTANHPFRGGKATLYEGGVRVPLIISGPAIKDKGTWASGQVDMTDLFPTLLELAGQEVQSHYARPKFFGRSILPVLMNRSGEYQKDTMYWHYPYNVRVPDPYDNMGLGPHSAIRRGDFKLIYRWRGDIRLFDVAKDPFENNDLAAAQPELACSLLEQLEEWITDDVAPEHLPVINPNFQGRINTRSGGSLDGSSREPLFHRDACK